MTLKKFEPKGKDVLKQEVIEGYGLDPATQEETINKIVEDRYKDEVFKANEKNRTEKLRVENKNLFKAKEFYKKPKREAPNGQEDKYATKDDLNRLSHRNRYSYMEDEEYSSIEAIAKSTNKSFEETLEKNPIASTFVGTIDVEKRLAGAVKAPGTRINTGEQKTEEDKIADELSGDLPRGFKSN